MILEYAVGEDVGDTLDDLREELQAALTEHKGHPGLRSPDGRKALEDIRDSIERRSVAHASAALPTTPRGPGGTSNAGSGLSGRQTPEPPTGAPAPPVALDSGVTRPRLGRIPRGCRAGLPAPDNYGPPLRVTPPLLGEGRGGGFRPRRRAGQWGRPHLGKPPLCHSALQRG